MGDGLCHGNWRVDSGGMDGVEDEPLRVQRGSTLVRDERGNAGGRRAVRAGDVKRGCGVGWVAGRPGHGCIAACGKPGGIGVCRRFVSVALALLGGAVSAALTPVFSEMVARGEWRECRRTVRLWAWGALAVATAVAGALIAGSRMLVGMTLQHGAFGARDSAAVSGVLVMYALQIPFFVSSRVFYRLLVAARRTDVVLYCGVLNLALDVALNLVLMRWMGVAGIALATSLWTVSTFIFL
jgi:peptidoglycan biosynthesis protein MviN/MurJ (putative lipid II flippase)